MRIFEMVDAQVAKHNRLKLDRFTNQAFYFSARPAAHPGRVSINWL
jgi:hypothetical protein